MAATAKAPRAWQRMLSGRRLDLLDPSPLDVEIEDIAHGLARVARWNGQTRGDHAFSVAQHSLLVEAYMAAMQPALTPREKMAALLHDAPEYVIGDMISPFKAVIGGGYKTIEHALLSAIHLRHGLPNPSPAALVKLIKRADHASAHVEAVQLAGFSRTEAIKLFGPVPVALPGLADLIAPMAAGEAQRRFLARFHAIEAALTAKV